MVAAEEFITAWQRCNSRLEVSRKTGMALATIDVRASYYRKRGVPLKSYRANRQPYNWRALAALARKLAA